MCGSTEELLDRVFSCRYVPALVLSMLCMPLAMASAPDAFDLLIRNGLVIDGTGSDPRRADVGVRDGHIVAVGDFAEARAKASIDASGLVVAPGFIDTDMTRAVDEAQRDAWMTVIPLGRFGDPADVASAVLYLASPAGGYLTGQTLHVNGGMHMP